MPLFYTKLQRRFGKPQDGLTRREMLQATLAASAGLLISASGSLRAGQAGQAGHRRRRRLLRPRRRLRAEERRLRRPAARGAQPRRRTRHHLPRFRPRQARRRRRRAGGLEPSDLGLLRRALQAFLPRRHRGRGFRLPDDARRQAALQRRSRQDLGGAGRGRQPDERRRRQDRRSAPGVAGAERQGARREDARVVDRLDECLAALQAGDRRDDERRQRRPQRVAELSRQPGDGAGRRRRHGTGPTARSTAAPRGTRRWRRSCWRRSVRSRCASAPSSSASTTARRACRSRSPPARRSAATT